MLADLLPILACPWCGAGPLRASVARSRAGIVERADLTCPSCGRTSEIRDAIWLAMGFHRPHRTLAQLSNVLPPVPQLYERVWRVRSLSLLSRRALPIDEELTEMLDATSVGAGDVAVDVACSEGLYARGLAARGARVIAVDHSLPFLRRARDHALATGHPIAAVRALAQHLPVLDASAAAVVMGGSLNEIGDAPQAVLEAGRVLADDGRWFDMSLTRAGSTAGRVVQALARPSGIWFPTVAETLALHPPAGLHVERVREDGVVLRITATRNARRS